MSTASNDRYTGPWSLASLQRAPGVEWLDREGPVRSLLYLNEPYQGRPAQVFAYYAAPDAVAGSLPGMVLVHGGGGRAFPEWVEMWAEHGYAALAMDLAGCGADGERLPDGGPPQDHEHKFERYEGGMKDLWSYHAVAAVIRGISFLAAQPEVDATRIGITGISWGGYLVCIVAGLDQRLRFAVPVYGCGFLHENSAWLSILADLPAKVRRAWIENYDPSRYLPQAHLPMLWINGTNDLAYPLDSYGKSYHAAPGPRTLRITVAMAHGHQPGWAPDEIARYADAHLAHPRRRQAPPPLPRLGRPVLEGRRMIAGCATVEPLEQARLHYTCDGLDWSERRWHTVPGELGRGRVIGALPADCWSESPVALFMTVTDHLGATVSTDLIQLPTEEEHDGPHAD